MPPSTDSFECRSILPVCSERPESLGPTDRIPAFPEGRSVAMPAAANPTQAEILLPAAGAAATFCGGAPRASQNLFAVGEQP
jgi:hypothetical protein